MQTINLDLSVRSIIPLLHAKQGDVGRKFKAILTDGGAAYPVPAGAAVSVWYSGASGEGNYTDIGADSAVSVSGNEITVELITQMLTNYGDGKLCLAINTADGDQIGTWNIPYMVEPLPGMGSAAAQQYFTAFSQAVENLPYPDTTLSVPGRAADAAATGAALALKAPAGYGLGRSMSPTITEIDNHLVNGWLRYDGEIEGYSNGWSGMQYTWDGPGNGCQILRHRYHCFEIIRYRRADEWQPWEWVNSPMEVGVEYRTTERYMGKAVYTKRMNLGALPNASTQTYNSLSTGAVDILDYALTISGKNGDSYANNGLVHEVGQSGGGALWAQIKTSSNLSAYTGCITLKYTKD